MNVPILSKRRDAFRKRIEDDAIKKAAGAVTEAMEWSGIAEKSFLTGNAAQMGNAGMGGAATMMGAAGYSQPGTSWSNQGSLSNALVARVTQNLASGFARAPEDLELGLAEQGMSWGPPFPPGRPLDPFWGYRRAPRTWDYSVGENVQLAPRWNRVSFQTIKSIYEAYDVAQICVRHLINDVRSLDYNWEPIHGIKADVSGDIEQAIAFFDSPDKRQPFRAWLAEYLQDVLRYDAGALYVRRNEQGDPIALEVVSGETIIPLVDFYGRRPEDENDNEAPEDLFTGEVVPSYVQIINGLPWDWLASDDLIYQPWNPLPDSQYGLAPLEAVMLSANTDIRFQWHFLNFFTQGTVPAGFMEAPPDQSDPNQIAHWQEVWDAVMQGDQTKNRQVRWVPNGSKFTDAKPGSNTFNELFPLYLMRRTASAFGVTPNDLGFTESVNRATGDTQIDVQFRVGTQPLLRHCEDVINLFVRQHLKLRCRIRFDDGKETEDRVATATAAGVYLDHGVIGVDEVRQELGLHVDKSRPMPRYINNARTGPIPLLALESMAGQIDPETYGPSDQQKPVDTPFSPAPGVVPPQGSPEQKAAAEHTAQNARDLQAATAGGAAAGGEATGEGEREEEAEGDAEDGAESGVAKYAPAFDDEEVSVDGQSGYYVQMVQDGVVALSEEPGGEAILLVSEDNVEPVEGPFIEVKPNVFEQVEKAARGTGRWVLSAKGVDNIGGPGVTRGLSNPTTVTGGTDGITVATGIEGVDLLDDEDDEDDDLDAAAKEALVALAVRRWRDNSRNRLKKGRAPRRFVDPNLPAAVHDEVWAKLSTASSRAEVDAAFDEVGRPKPLAAARAAVKAERPPFHHNADRIVEHYAPLIASALGKLFSSSDLDAAVAAGAAAKKSTVAMKGARSGMVSLDLPPGTFPGSEEGDHITVVFLGSDVTDETFAAVCARVKQVAEGSPPLTVEFTGTGTFPASDGSDGKIPVFAVPDVPGVDAIHAALAEFNASEHTDYKPHCTLAYADDESEVEQWKATPLPDTPVLVAGLSVHLGANVQTFPFSAGPPPNLRASENSLARCKNCCLFDHPVCVRFGDWPVKPDQTCDGWELAIDDQVQKAGGEDPARAAAIESLKGAGVSVTDLQKVMEGLYGDSFLTGSHDAAHAAGGTIVASLEDVSEQVPADYWSAWKPGYGEAAARVADGGMKELLDQAGITIKGLTDSSIDDIGSKVAAGLEAGSSVQAVGKELRAVLEDPSRSETVANTETARATSAAAEDTYSQNGITQVDWLAEDDACPECEALAAESPLDLGSDSPPAHPNCRCAIAPVVDLGGGESEGSEG